MVRRLDFGDQIRDVFRLRAYGGTQGPDGTPAKPGERKVVIVIFVVERVIRVELRHRRRMGFAISV